jgi:hypothetical protein
MDGLPKHVTRAPGVVASHVDGQLVALSPDLRFVALDATGEAIWELLATPTSTDAVVAAMLERFDIDEATCRGDVDRFVGQLAAHGLVTLT